LKFPREERCAGAKVMKRTAHDRAYILLAEEEIL